MRAAFLQFCTATKKHFPQAMFGHDTNIGSFPLDIKVVCAFLSFLRYGGEDVAPAPARKLSTIHNNWQEVKQGLIAELAPGTTKPEWLLCFRRRPLYGKFCQSASPNYMYLSTKKQASLFPVKKFWIYGFIEVLGPESWILDPGCWILDPGSWILGPGSWILDLGSWILDPGS